MSSIRKELLELIGDDEQVRDMVRAIDRAVVNAHDRKRDLQRARQLMLGGSLVFLIGLAVTVLTHVVASESGGVYFIAYGAVIGGAGSVYAGWRLSTQVTTMEDRPGSLFNLRPRIGRNRMEE